MHCVSAVALQDENAPPDDRDNYISLPRLFNLPVERTRHSIVMKNHGDENNDENRTILFIPEVECETDISVEEIYPVPQALSGTRFSSLFSGIQFNSRPELARSGPVLLLKSENLIQSEHKETMP